MRPNKERRGQFVIIAVMLTAIMLVSIGAIMHNAVTYYKHEPWEEYSTLVGDVEVNSKRIVELSLASYTQNSGAGASILSDNLARWQNDLAKIYPNDGISLTSSGYELSRGSNPTAKVSLFTLKIGSIGLKGYTFSALVSLSLDARQDSSKPPYNIAAIVKTESGQPALNLGLDNFLINGTKPKAVAPFYDQFNTIIYRIEFQGTFPAEVQVTDHRGICAIDVVS